MLIFLNSCQNLHHSDSWKHDKIMYINRIHLKHTVTVAQFCNIRTDHWRTYTVILCNITGINYVLKNKFQCMCRKTKYCSVALLVTNGLITANAYFSVVRAEGTVWNQLKKDTKKRNSFYFTPSPHSWLPLFTFDRNAWRTIYYWWVWHVDSRITSNFFHLSKYLFSHSCASNMRR